MTTNVKAAISFIDQTKKIEKLSEHDNQQQFSFTDEKMIEAFGMPLLNSEGKERTELFELIWLRVAKLRGKQYRLPGGACGIKFTRMYSEMWQDFADEKVRSDKPICFPPLILQRTRNIKKTADIRRLLEKRMKLWEDSNFQELLEEVELCDKKLPRSYGNITDEQAVKIFSQLILIRKKREAAKFITERGEVSTVLQPTDDNGKGVSVLEDLKIKHPPQATANAEAFIECKDLPILIDVDISAEHVEKVARMMGGSAGTICLDSYQWQALILKFGTQSESLRESMAAVIRRLANSFVDWNDIRALKAKRLIALAKCPGVRPIGIGEIADRFCSKVMVYITGEDVQMECGTDQLCSGLKSGIEAGIHAIKTLFNDHSEEGWGLLLIDAANAFNSISRPMALWNARILWPRCSRFLSNSYSGFALLIIRGSEVMLFSREGVTQGDPLAMQFYAIGVMPLVRLLKEPQPSRWVQNWFADDSACIAALKHLKEWLKILLAEGPKFGYFAEPNKSYLIVSPAFIEVAKEMFSEFQINVVTGNRFLGSYIGSVMDTKDWIEKKVEIWCKAISCLSEAAKLEPHAAFVAMTKSVQNEWGYLQRVCMGCEDYFSPLKASIELEFLPALTGVPISDVDAAIMQSPAKIGGIGIRDAVATSRFSYRTSVQATSIAADAISKGTFFDFDQHIHHLKRVTGEMKCKKNDDEKTQIDLLINRLPDERKAAVKRIQENNCSTWLSVFPTYDNDFALSPDAFRDGIANRYCYEPPKLQQYCDGCGEFFNRTHALTCKKGGLICLRHNELRDLNIQLCQKAGLRTVREPVLKEATEEVDGLRVDWGVRGFWEPQREALFDTCILNADAISHRGRSLNSIFTSYLETKKGKYAAEAESRRASFTPIIATCEGIFENEAITYFKRLSALLSEKWKKPYSQVVGWVRARIQLCIIRSISLCLRGSRTKWLGVIWEDGAGMPIVKDS